jgi:nucleoside-diphosphate-sugar epimerase
MRIFLTGATGFIGSHIIPELLDRGHRVLGLARSDTGAEQLEARSIAATSNSLRHSPAALRRPMRSSTVRSTTISRRFSKIPRKTNATSPQWARRWRGHRSRS